MDIDWEAVRTFWNGSGWEWAFLVGNLLLALYAYLNYLALASLGNISEKVAAVADDAARIGAIRNLRRIETIKRRIDRVRAAANKTVQYVFTRIWRIILLGIFVPLLLTVGVVSVSGGITPNDALAFTLNNFLGGVLLDTVEVFDWQPFGVTSEPDLSVRLLSVFVVMRASVETTFLFSVLSGIWAVVGSLRLRIPGLRPASMALLNERLREAEDRLAEAA